MSSTDILLKQDGGDKRTIQNAAKDKRVQTQKAMQAICHSIMRSSKDYDPQETVNEIVAYIQSEIKLERILYSEISNFIFSLNESEIGIFNTNIDNLLQYAQNKDFLQGQDTKLIEDSRKIIVKIYDHSQLAVHQIENASSIVARSLEQTENKINEKFKDELKKIEREYITILGIFASMVFAFVAAITVSSSVLQHIAATNVYRLLMVVDFLAGMFLCAIHMLIRFILTINDKKKEIVSVWWIVGICVGIAGIIVFAWLIDFRSAPSYIVQHCPLIPWKK